MSALTLRAKTVDFQGVAVELETGGPGLLQNYLVQGLTFQLYRAAAFLAQQKMIVMPFVGSGAPDKGIQATDPVDQALLQEKIQGPVDRRRRHPPGRLGAQFVHQGIGPQRFVILPDQLQHLLTQRGQAGAPFPAELLGFGQRGIHAAGMIVTAKSEWRLSHVKEVPSANEKSVGPKCRAGKMLHYNFFSVTLCRHWLEAFIVMSLTQVFAGWFRSPIRVVLLSVLLQGFALPAQAQVEVLASIKPLGLIAQEVVGNRGQADSLLSGSASPHDYPLKVSDIQRLKRADLVLWVGPELETFLSKALEQLPPQQQLQAQRLDGLNWPSDEEGSESGGDHHEHFHERDPHLWLDPRNGARIALALAERLAELDPAGAETYRTNASQLAQKLNTLDQQLQQRLDKVSDRGFAVYHQGYAHFVQRYGLNQLGYVTYGPEQRPGARHLYRLRQRLAANAQCLFTEPYYDTSSAKQMAQDLNLKLGHLDPLGAENISSYPALIESMAEEFLSCLGADSD